MRPISSNYDTEMEASFAHARTLVDPDAVQVGDVIEYETAEDVGEVGWRWLQDQLYRRGMETIDEGSGYEVRAL